MKDVATFTNIANPWDFMGNPYNDTGNEDIWAIYSGFNKCESVSPAHLRIGAAGVMQEFRDTHFTDA